MATIKKLTPEYVEAQTLPFEAWDWKGFEKAEKVLVTKYDLSEGASIKTIVFRPVAGAMRDAARCSVDFLYQDEQSVLTEIAEAKAQAIERPEYEALLEQRNGLLAALKKSVLLYYMRIDVATRMREQGVPVGAYAPGKPEWVTEAEVVIAKAEGK